MQNFIKESKKIIQKSIENNKLIVFVGAGVSANSGYPLWSSLIEKFANSLGICSENLSGDDYLRIPQYYYNSRKEKEYYTFVMENMMNDEAKPNPIHSLIFDLNPIHVITTNYDELLEQVASEKGMFYDIVSKDCDLPYTPNNKMIIKMHGDFKNKNIVLKEDDYLSYSKNFKLIETYIKSLLSSHLILFVGYSINDMDVKYIFQWVKDILAKDFQQAYFINIDKNKEFNQMEFDYYKNRGINILYYTQASQIDDFDKDTYVEGLNSDRGIKTYRFLNYLLKEDKVEQGLDQIVEKLEYLNNMNSIRHQDIFSNLNIGMNYSYKNYEIIAYSEDIKNFFNKLNAIKEKVQKGTDEDDKIKLQVINDIFTKAGIYKISGTKNISKNENNIIIEFKSSNLQLNPLHQMIFECNYNGVYKFIRERNLDEFYKNENDLLEKAYAFYKIKNYYEAYILLKQISNNCFRSKKYVMYFISEFNRFHVGRIITFSFGIDEVKRNKIKNEINKIDLDNLYLKLPLKNRHHFYFLRDILNFKFVYSQIAKVLKYSTNVEKETGVVTVGVPLNSGKIYEMKNQIKSFWQFMNYNLLMIDGYPEVKQVYYQYIESVLMSHSIKDQEEKETILGLKGRIIKLSKLDYFTFYVMVNYLDIKEIKYLLNKYKVNKLDFLEDDIEILKLSYSNLISSILELEYSAKYVGLLNNYLKLLSKIDVGKELFIGVIDGLLKVLNNKFLHDNHYENLISFLIGQNNYFQINIEIRKLEDVIIDICTRIVTKRTNPFDDRNVTKLIKILGVIIHNVDNQYKLEQETMVDCLINEWVKNGNSGYITDIIVHLYKLLSKELKVIISNNISKKLTSKNEYKLKDFKLYYSSLFNNIIPSNETCEDRVISFLDNMIYERLQSEEKGKISYPNPIEENLGLLGNLLLNNMIINKEKFSKYRDKNEQFEFFYDLENYIFDKFKIEWLMEFNDSLHEMLSKNKIVKQNIQTILKEYIMNENIDKFLIDIYFKYYE